VAPSAH